MKRRKFLSLWIILCSFIILGLCDTALAGGTIYRSILKTGGLLAAILGIVGISIAAYVAGKNYDSYTGWERFTHGAGMFFNRKPFTKECPTYQMEGPTRRVEWIESLEGRIRMFEQLLMPPGGGPRWAPSMGIEALPEPLKSYYNRHREDYNLMIKGFDLMEKQKADWPKFSTQFAIADAWSKSMGSLFDHPDEAQKLDNMYPPEPAGPPDEWDYRNIRRETPLPFISPSHASQLIKKVTHTFGATLVGITKLNPDWCFQSYLRGVGPGEYKVPSHWEYAIVFATPHEWDQLYVNPVYGSSFDAYSQERIIAGRLESFLHELGYPARSHAPPAHYDLMMPPVGIDAGLGEQCRMGLLLTPELGPNARLACVTTNVPMEPDKPIDIGVLEFCRKCKICAEKCPGGAISHKEHPDVEFGYRRWRIKCELCQNAWSSVAVSGSSRGCRICLAVCPYSRKNNWLHSMSRNIDPRDPTGLVSTALLWMQKAFFKYPEARDFMPPPQGRNATYHEPPDWLLTEKWFKVKKTW